MLSLAEICMSVIGRKSRSRRMTLPMSAAHPHPREKYRVRLQDPRRQCSAKDINRCVQDSVLDFIQDPV